MQKLILFDLDGTLTDSGPGIKKCVGYAFEKMGYPEAAKGDLGYFVGPPLIPAMMEYTGCTQEEAERGLLYFRERYDDKGVYENSVYPGMAGVLRDLKREDCLLGVASSKPEYLVIRVLKHFDLYKYFDFLVGAPADEKHGEKADIVERVLDESGYNRKRDQVLLVGDRKYDVYGAGKCGISCVGVTFGYGSREELEEAGADHIAETAPELDVLLLDLVRRDSFQIPRASAEEELPVREDGGPEYGGSSSYAVRRMSKGARVWDMLFPLVYAIVGIVAAGVAAGVVMAAWMLKNPGGDYSVPMAYATLIAIGAFNFFSAFFLPRLIRRDEIRFRDPLDEKWQWPSVLLSVLMMVMISHLLNQIIDITGLEQIFPGYAESVGGVFNNVNMWTLMITVVIIGPVAEELIFRGLFFRRIRRHLGVGWAVGISAAVFGIYHGNMVQFIYAAAIGVFLALICHRSGTVIAPVLCHVFCNLWSLFGPGILQVIFGGEKTAWNIFLGVEAALTLILIWALLIRKKNMRR